MRLFTSVSDKNFLVTLLFSAAILAAFFYYLAESFAETMLMEKKNQRVDSLRIEASQSEFALIGTSHADSHSMPDGMHYIRLTGGHNLPPAMYYEAKALLKYATSVRTVYIEADDHVFMNGPSYNVKKIQGDNISESYMYKSWHDYFDEEGKEIFGNKTKKDAIISSLALQQDVKPILLKRITKRVFHNIFDNTQENHAEEKSISCENNMEIAEPDLTKETYWSRMQGEKREIELMSRLGGFSLEKPSPLDPLMVEYYEKTVRLFLDEGIQVVFIRFPLSQDFQARVSPENTLTIKNYIDNLREKNNIPILDLGYLSKYGDRFFENEDHVHKDFFPLIGALIIDDFCKKRQKVSRL